MRPVLLDIRGFASFRERTVIDFTGADYFALVGPTGSGKSTVLDALTFALYGTAYRWGRANAIADALAPTSSQCVVRLVFDMGAHRYQVAREVRRVGQSIQQKSGSLERFDNLAAHPNPDPITDDTLVSTVLPGEGRGLTDAVEALIGLSFDDFCQCVVLPQGEFASFLKAKPGERQAILLKLLGASQYEGIGRRAGIRRDRAEQEIAVLTSELGTHADATEDAQAHAVATVATLGRVALDVDDLTAQIRDARTDAAQARSDAQAAAGHVTALAAIAVPDGTADLGRALTAAENAETAAAAAADEAATALTTAAAAVAAGPQKPALERAQERYADHDELAARRADVEAAATRAAALVETRRAEVADKAAVLAGARADLTQAAADHTAAAGRRDRIARVRSRLAEVRTPDGLVDLVVRAGEQTAAVTAAFVAATTAQHSLEQAEAALAAAPADRIDQARQVLAELRTTVGELAAAAATHIAAQGDAVEAAAARDRARTDLDAAEAALEAALETANAAQLRPHLQVGHACPVCDQDVATLPTPLPTDTLDDARTALAAAKATHARAVESATTAHTRLAAAQGTLEVRTERRAQLDTQLTGLLPGRAARENRDLDADTTHLADLATTRQSLVDAVSAAREARDTARGRHESVTRAAATLRDELGIARDQLSRTRGALTGLDLGDLDLAGLDLTGADAGPVPDLPEAAGDDLATSWRQLSDWAAAASAHLATAETAAGMAADTAIGAWDAAKVAVEAADRNHDAAQNAHTDAVRTATAAAGDRDHLVERLATLTGQLAGEPSAGDLPGLLDQAAALAAAHVAAQTADTAARGEVTRTRSARAQLAETARAARAALSVARDTVAALDPPQIDEDDLAGSWAAMTAWAQRAAAERTAAAEAASARATQAAADVDRHLAALTGLLTEHDVDLTGTDRAQLDADAQRCVAVATERANGELRRIRDALVASARLRERIDAARTDQQVATQLALMLRSNQFPQWLADSALDDLVASASESLRALSGGQFDLTHNKGGFFVIDHADADSQRSVRTLSGGETFQASLALALALSNHLAGLGGTTKLESIFLDEGFGTLDPQSLDTVAATLDNLAKGDRMVGLITHVDALAQQVPVRFAVTRDHRTSSVTRDTE